jgi:hypothetical protein
MGRGADGVIAASGEGEKKEEREVADFHAV